MNQNLLSMIVVVTSFKLDHLPWPEIDYVGSSRVVGKIPASVVKSAAGVNCTTSGL